MTTIFLCKTHIYTDSSHYRGSEHFHSLTKVKKLTQSLKVIWEPLDAEMAKCPAFEDTIHGYAVSGNNLAAGAFMLLLKESEGRLARVTEFYKASVRQLMIYQEAVFTAIMIGEKADYIFNLFTDGVLLETIERNNPCGWGSGCDYVSREYFRTQDPLRAMYMALWLDELSSGEIDIWTLPTVEYPTLERYGLCNARTQLELKQELDKHERLQPDLVLQKASRAYGDAMFELGRYFEATGEDPLNRKPAPMKLPKPSGIPAKKSTRSPRRKS